MVFWEVCVGLVALAVVASADDPYRFFEWNVTYGDIYPLGVPQQVCVVGIWFCFRSVRCVHGRLKIGSFWFCRVFLSMDNFQALIFTR